MSLQVWLPLTKNLEQQGLSNITVTNNGATFNSNGKLGGCYTVDNSKQIGCSNNITLGNAFSVTFWSKINSKNVDWGNIFKIYKDGCDYIGMCLAYKTDANPKLGFHIYRNNGSNTREAVIDGYKDYTLNEWFHTAIIVTPTKAIVYRNGEIYNTFVINKSFPLITNYSLWLGKSGIGNGLDCSINDFRIYDHALSPLEVKHLAQGLVLHYPLNRGGFGGENYLKNSNFTNGTNSWYGVNNSSIRVELKDGKMCGTGSKGGSNNILGQTSAAYTANAKVNITVSAKIYVEQTGTIGIGNWISTTQATGWQNMSGSRVWHTDTNLSVGWNYISSTLENATNQYTGSIVTCFSYTGDTYWITDVKLEFGDASTPWVPNQADALYSQMGLDNNIEYDVSGYGNNGIRNGTFSWSSDTPRYGCSTIFNGTDNAIQTPNLTTMITDRNYTISCWTYKTTIGTKNYQTIYGGPSGFELEARSSSNTNPLFRLHNWGGGTTPYVFGEWTHFCFVHTDSDSKLYVNGELKITGSSVNIPSGNYYIGAWSVATSQNYDGLMSDFRIYATALSADDVMALYKNAGYVDSDGNVYAYEMTE